MSWLWWMLRVAVWAIVFFAGCGMWALDPENWLLWAVVVIVSSWCLIETAENGPGTIRCQAGQKGRDHG